VGVDVRRFKLARFPYCLAFQVTGDDIAMIAIAIRNVITLRTRSMTMTRMEARDLAKRIQVLPDAEQVKILSRVMQAEGRKVPWSDVEAIQRRMGKLDVDDEKFTREIVEAVREVRRERRRKSRS
jgi:hypothetical protein